VWRSIYLRANELSSRAWWLDICQSAPMMHLGLVALYKCSLTYLHLGNHTYTALY